MEAVFKALADGTRRGLLDDLFRSDGQTLTALASPREPMTRFGVMKHLKVLEEAGLVTTRKRGREKLHFLNPIPIRLIHERWVSKYAEPWAATLTELKSRLEADPMTTTKHVSFAEGTAPIAGDTAVFEIFIKTTPERLWQAIVDPEQRKRYSFGAEVQSDWESGSGYTSSAGGFELSRGTNVTVEPPRLLVQTFEALWGDDVKSQGETRVTWEIEPVGTSCRLTVIHDRLPDDANAQLYGGWPMVLSGLKTLLETGEDLDTPGSLRYSGAA